MSSLMMLGLGRRWDWRWWGVGGRRGVELGRGVVVLVGRGEAMWIVYTLYRR